MMFICLIKKNCQINDILISYYNVIDHEVLETFLTVTMYLLTEWEGQIFSRPARPNSVNKHFII